MGHADIQARRLFTRAANTSKPHVRKNLRKLARGWAARALETDAERNARVDAELERNAVLVLQKAAERAAAASRKALAAVRAEHWLERQAARFAHETPAARASRLEEEMRQWQEHKTQRAALLSKRKKVRVTLNQEQREARAERQRQREAIAETKRAAKRKTSAPRICPPLPY